MTALKRRQVSCRYHTITTLVITVSITMGNSSSVKILGLHKSMCLLQKKEQPLESAC